jgi:hypothetical protein
MVNAGAVTMSGIEMLEIIKSLWII